MLAQDSEVHDQVRVAMVTVTIDDSVGLAIGGRSEVQLEPGSLE
jgi:hypothetical protein